MCGVCCCDTLIVSPLGGCLIICHYISSSFHVYICGLDRRAIKPCSDLCDNDSAILAQDKYTGQSVGPPLDWNVVLSTCHI